MKHSKDQVKRKKYKVIPFSIINYFCFVIVTITILIPIIKIFVDSVDAKASYGINLWPKEFTASAYHLIVTTSALYKPFAVSCYVTILGTLFGLILSTIGAYVLIQFDMPGRKFLSYLLLFTMIFNGGMVPTYLAMKQLNLLDSLWVIILPASLNVYNIILMRNFFESIPKSLFESAEIDGCSPLGIFFRIVLPLSKAALASIGLMFGVAFWNEFTNFTIYISDSNIMNFQVMLRTIILEDSSLAGATSVGIFQTTVKNAAIIIAIVPFIIIYPFCQRYFVTGINMGAVKE